MIEYDYLLKNDMGSRVAEYRPGFSQRINNVAKFVGYNSSGKSTLLTFIALASFGLDDQVNMIPKLREKLKVMADSKYLEYTFDLLVDSNIINTKLKIHLEKNRDGGAVSIEESVNDDVFRKLTKEKFLKKYRLIYDMPDRPMERVQELIRETEYAQKNCTTNLENMRKTLNSILGQLSNSRDEERIKELRVRLDKKETEIVENDEALKNLLIKEQKLKQLFSAINIFDAQMRINSLSRQFSSISNEDRKKSAAIKKDMRYYSQQVDRINEKFTELKKSFDCSVIIFKENKNLINSIDEKIWLEYEVDDIRKKNSVPSNFVPHAHKMIEELNKQFTTTGMERDLSKYHVISEIINLLKPHISENISILDQSAKDLYDRFFEEYMMMVKKVDTAKKVKDLINYLNLSSKYASEVSILLSSLGPKPVPYDGGNTSEEIFDQLQKARKDLEKMQFDAAKVDVSIDNYLDIIEGLKNEQDLEKYTLFDSNSLNFVVEEIADSVTKLRNLLDGKNGLRLQKLKLAEKIEKEEKFEEHELKNYAPELKKLEQKLEWMQADLSRKNKILNNLTNGVIPNIIKGDETYLELIWANLGKRFEYIQHVGEIYEIVKVDMINRQLIAIDGSIIRFDDMGTGESQNAYLMGLLNSNDNRVIIALFDEVDHMDPHMVGKINDKFLKLYNEGQLIIGLMAAPGSNREVE